MRRKLIFIMTLNWGASRIVSEVVDEFLPGKMRGLNMKNPNTMHRKALTALPGIGLLSLVGTSQATMFEIDFSNAGTFYGTAPSLPVSPSSVYATAIFDDHGGTGSVTLTMSVLSDLLPSSTYASDWYFNSRAWSDGIPHVVVRISKSDSGIYL